MKVILQQDVKNVGKRGEVVNASDGYARNFLFPKKLAIPADKQNMNEWSAKKSAEAHKKELEKITLTIKTKAGENGKTFGSITSKEIAEAISKEFNKTVDKKKIIIKEQIKTLGTHSIELRLFEGVIAKLKVEVISE